MNTFKKDKKRKERPKAHSTEGPAYFNTDMNCTDHSVQKVR